LLEGVESDIKLYAVNHRVVNIVAEIMLVDGNLDIKITMLCRLASRKRSKDESSDVPLVLFKLFDVIISWLEAFWNSEWCL